LRTEPPQSPDDVYIFAEPLIEKAVRLSLGKDKSEPVLRGELERIEELYLIGDDFGFSEEEFNYIMDNNVFIDISYYKLERLDDFKFMPNLKKLFLRFQPYITDISPLAAHPNLGELLLYHTNVSDISPLTTIPNLYRLYLFDTYIDDFSHFEKMPSLRNLQVGHIPIRSIAEFGDISNILHLNLHLAEIENLDGIEKFVNLTGLNVAGTTIRDFSPLARLPNFEALYISSDMEQYLHTLSRNDIEIRIWDLN
jgi:hypothetical protein